MRSLAKLEAVSVYISLDRSELSIEFSSSISAMSSSAPSNCGMAPRDPRPARLSYNVGLVGPDHLGLFPDPEVSAGPGLTRTAAVSGGRLSLSLGPGISLAANLFWLAMLSSFMEAWRSFRAISGETLVQVVSPGSLMLAYKEPS